MVEEHRSFLCASVYRIGLNICRHGVVREGRTNFAGALVPMFQKTLLPAWSVYSRSYVLRIEREKVTEECPLSHGSRFPDGVIVAAKYSGISSRDNGLEIGDIIHQVNGLYIHDVPTSG